MSQVYVLVAILVAIVTLLGYVVKLTSVIVTVKVMVEEYILEQLKEIKADVLQLQNREYDRNAVRNPEGRRR